jgi:hypothetical protein
VGAGGESDHYPILLEVAKGRRKPTSPFKFNPKWLKEESFIDLVKEQWVPFDPKLDSPQSFEEFHPISLCNCIYKIVAKVIARRLKPILSYSISKEQFGFLEGRKIHEAIGVAQEGLHSIKTRILKGAVVKIDLSKAYDRVSWIYIRLILTHVGFEVPFINWVMSCISTTTFVVLINGEASPFFHAGRGLRQGCPLSPLLFLLVEEGLSRSWLMQNPMAFSGYPYFPCLISFPPPICG